MAPGMFVISMTKVKAEFQNLRQWMWQNIDGWRENYFIPCMQQETGILQF